MSTSILSKVEIMLLLPEKAFSSIRFDDLFSFSFYTKSEIDITFFVHGGGREIDVAVETSA